MTYLWLLLGFGLLVGGAEALVRGGVSLAWRMGVTPLLIGLTVVAYGTSAPELFVSVDAALKGASGIAVGNVVGSNICNILLILGLVGVIRPIPVDRRSGARDLTFALAAAGAFVAVALTGDAIRWWHGLPMLAGLAAMIAYTYRQEKCLHGEGGANLPEAPRPLWVSLGAVAIGLGLLVLGASLLVEAAVDIARALGVSEAVIGLTLVAVGTSLPELATAVVAAIHGRGDISFGNILGSNILNVLLILGVASLFGALPIPAEIKAFDTWVMLAATLLLVPVVARRGIGRAWGAVALGGYCMYLFALFRTMPS